MLKKYRHTIICSGILLLLSILGCLMIIVRYLFTENLSHVYLIWNLFLSWIPLGLSILMTYLYTNSKGKAVWFLLIPLGGIWLLFYPNAPYMLTDFIHLGNYDGFLVWYDLVVFSVFIWTSFLVGFVSIYLINRIIERALGKVTAWLCVLFALFLSSYGIYLGRFIRWNSWDMLLNPIQLLQSVIDNINFQSFTFSCIFGLLLTLTYAFLYGLTYLKLEKI